LSRTAPIRIYALVDADPDGLAIMSTYKYGSVAQLHENANLNVRRIEWLGLCTSELLLEAENLSDSSLMPLSLRDRKKAMAMLARSPVFAEDGPEATWRDELQRMLVINSKAEIEFLYELRGGLEGWLDRKLVEMA
jgi:meiotic recombination protein SPO11